MSSDQPLFEQNLLPEPEQTPSMTTWDKARVVSGMVVLAIGQALAIKGIENHNMPDIIVADAVALPVGLGLALSVREMRRRIPVLNRRASDCLKEPTGETEPRQQG